MKQSTRVLVALLVGLILGALVAASQSADLESVVAAIEPLGTLWTNAIRMTVVPLVVALLIRGVAGSDDPRQLGSVGRRIIPIFLALLVAGGILSMAVGAPVMSGLQISPDAAESMRNSAVGDQTAPPPAMPSLRDRIIEIVPVNPIRAAADAAMLPLVVFALLFAIALTKLERDQREPIVSFFRALADAMMVLVRWVLAVAPIGIFALALGLGMRMGASAAGALLYYVVALAIVLSIYTILIYPAVLIMCGVPLRKFAAAVAEAQGIAITTRSSLAATSALMTGANDKLGAPLHVSGFAVPLAVSVFRPNVPMAWAVGVLFLAKLYGVEVGVLDLLGVVAIATFISFSVPGIPSASLFMLAPVLENLGIPAAGAGILIAVDAIPDMFKTTANVTSHMAVAACLSKGSGAQE